MLTWGNNESVLRHASGYYYSHLKTMFSLADTADQCMSLSCKC